MEHSKNHYDVIVIGAGPGGVAAAIRSAQKGARVLLIEKDVLGGTCLNHGCIPLKTLLYAAEEYENIKSLAAFGIKTSAAAFDIAIAQDRKRKIIRQLQTGIASLLTSYAITLVTGTASFDNESSIRVTGHKGESNTYTYDHLIIAAGSMQKRMPVIEGNTGCLTSDQALEINDIPSSVLIIGGGFVGLEYAALLHACGSAVYIVEILDHILPSLDQEICGMLLNECERQEIRIYTEARIKTIKNTTAYVQLHKQEQSIEIPAQARVWAGGRQPCYNSLQLDRKGIEYTEQGIVVDNHMRTSQRNVYAIGDITGVWQLAYTAHAQGLVAAENCAGHSSEIDYTAVPCMMYTHPQCSWVGLSEGKARSHYGKDAIRIGRFPMAASSKAAIMGSRRGLVKIITDAQGIIIGCHMLGPDACELISTAAIAVKTKMNISQWTRELFPHPSLVENLFYAAEDLIKYEKNTVV